MRIPALSFLVFLLLPLGTTAQETAPTVFRSESTVVLVPTLVLNGEGEILYGLSAEDFLVKDNGVEQKVHLDDAPDSRPVSLIVVAQTGNHAAAVLAGKHGMGMGPGMGSPFPTQGQGPGGQMGMPPGNQLAGFGGVALMLESLLSLPGSKMALVTFDSQIKLAQNFTPDADLVTHKLRSLSEGDSGNAILDALRFSLERLEQEPRDHRRVLFLISELHDHGSVKADFNSIVRQIMATNTELYSLAFSGNALEVANLLAGQLSNLFMGNLRFGGRPSMGRMGGGPGGPGVAPGMGGMGGPGMGGMGGGPGMGGGARVGAASGTMGGMGSGTPGTSGSTNANGPSGPGMGMGPGQFNPIQAVTPFVSKVAEAMKRNIPQGIADLTGGEYIVFNDTRRFEEALDSLANHAHNRYQLSFQSKNPTPGLHTLDVFVNASAGVSARRGYLVSRPLTQPKAQQSMGGEAKINQDGQK